MPYSKITVPVLVGEGLTEWDVIDVMRETHPPTIGDQYHYHTFDSMQNRTIFVLENPLYPDVDKIPEKVLEIAVDALEDMLDNVPVEELPIAEEQGKVKRFTTKLASIVFDVFLIIPDFVSVTAKEE